MSLSRLHRDHDRGWASQPDFTVQMILFNNVVESFDFVFLLGLWFHLDTALTRMRLQRSYNSHESIQPSQQVLIEVMGAGKIYWLLARIV